MTNVVGIFRSPLSATTQLLEGTGLEPGFTLGGDALVALSFFEYRRTTVGPYNEVGTATFVKRRGDRAKLLPYVDVYGDPDQRVVGAHIFDLPVTTKAAWAAGRELWGYPKFVTPISFRLGRSAFESTVSDPDGHGTITTLAGELGPSVPAPPMSLMLYSHLDGRMLRTNVNVRGRVHAHDPGSCRLAIGESRHPMAERLRKLRLDGAKPLVVLSTTEFQSRLHAGVLVENPRK